MFEKLEETEKRYNEIENKIFDPEIIQDQTKYSSYIKEYKSIKPIVLKFREYKKIKTEIDDAKILIETETDPEMKEYFKNEMTENEKMLDDCVSELKYLLLPKDPKDSKNVIIEIRAGAGGEEAALFCGVLYRMYSMFAESEGWKSEIIGSNETELGGFKEISFMIEGDGAYSKLKYESGVHRVQRVPETESQGRIQTSTVTVAVLPEAEEVEVEINQNDLEIDTHRASGAGGQHINKTDSAIRILHKPTGIVVECQDERSQYKNRDKAMKVLRTKLYELELEKKNDEISSARKSQIGTGDRSERIRTYNYPQSRITDHRIGLTLHSLEACLNGKIGEIIEALASEDRLKKLSSGDIK